MNVFLRVWNPNVLSEMDVIQRTQLKLSYRLCLFIAIAVALLEIDLVTYSSASVVIAGIFVIAIAVAALIYMSVSGKYFLPAFIFNFFGVVICHLLMWAIPEQLHVFDVMWVVINIIFSFLVLGLRWGLIISTFHVIGVVTFFLVHLHDQIQLIREFTPQQEVGATLNVGVCLIIIIYLVAENIKTNNLAKSQLYNTQEELQLQYNVISKQSDDKTVMLKEIHHRVKNNLQIITSLLRLQARELESPEAIEKFKDATQRVIAMSMIHEKMYQTDTLSKLHLREYLHDLSSELVSSYQSGYQVDLQIECKVESIGLKSVVPLALILNELISNTLKYAFDSFENCAISISFTKHSESESKLIYKDSGTWKTPTRRDSFGLDLIDSLTDQLEGTLETSTFPETKFTFILRTNED